MSAQEGPPREPFRGLPKYNWRPVSREMFPRGSLGRSIFPPELEGRLRPENMFVERYDPDDSLGYRFVEEGIELATVHDLLRLPIDRLDGLPAEFTGEIAHLRRSAKEAIEQLGLLPHLKVLQALFGRLGYGDLAPLDFEDPIIQGVESAIDMVPNQDTKRLLIRRFGLITGRPESLQKMAYSYGIKPDEVRRTEVAALRDLRRKKEVEDMLLPYVRA